MIFLNLIAHRGLIKNGSKENTLASFQNAIEDEQYQGFEFDIRTSKDGVFFVYHNIFLDGQIFSSLTSQELTKKYHITKLEEVLKLKTDKIMLLEIKEPNLNIDLFLELINQYPKKNLYIDSFDNKIIQKLIQKDQNHNYGVLNYVINSEKSYQEYQFIGLLSAIITEDLLTFFKEKNIKVFIYGLPKNPQLQEIDNVYYIIDAKK